jgi:hypothetical protein
LILNQRHVRSLEPIADVIDGSAGAGGNFGCLRFDEWLWPVFALADDLSVMDACPPSRPLCALIEELDMRFAVACDQFELVAERDLQLHPVPACMTTPHSAIDAVAIHEDGIALFCSTARLARLLGITNNGED